MAVIVLLGPTGQVGFELARSLAPFGQLYCLSRADVDFSDTQAVKHTVAALQPDVIVNAAAWTAVDKAETQSEAAYLLNAALPEALAQVAQQLNAWLVHYSSDYVYPGTGTEPWQEDSQTAPLSVYGASKLAGDIAVQQYCTKHLIFRTSWVYAARGTNFMCTMLKLALSREALKVVADQVGAPTPARLIAQVSSLALQQALQRGAEVSGIYHLAPQGETSWYGFADAIFSLARQQGLVLQLQAEKFEAITTSQYPTPATRPSNSRLSLKKIEQTFGIQMPGWNSQLEFTIEELLNSQMLLQE
jgi:dTDP-4-dehydrorhamnose reductase